MTSTNITDVRGGKYRQSSSRSSGENLSASFAHKAGPREKLCERYEKTGRGFEHVKNKFPNVSDEKIKEGLFIGPQIRELMLDKQFDEDLNETERNARLSFKKICKDFLGNHKAAKYQDVVQDLLTS